MEIPANTNLTALATGAGALISGVAALTATGALGRLERNEPEILVGAVTLALLGSTMLVIAGLPITSGRSEIFAVLVGTGLNVVAIGWALGAGIFAAGQRERPELHVQIDAKGNVDGTVKAGNLASDKSLAVLVDGLNRNANNEWDNHTLAQYYVGPDGDGKVELPVKVLLPPGEYDAVGVKAWTEPKDTCEKYPLRVFGLEQRGSGCVVIPTSAPVKPAAAAKAVEPLVSLQWRGRPSTSRRAVLVTRTPTPGRRIVVLAAGKRQGRTRQLLRMAGMGAEPRGFRGVAYLHAGKRYNRICARAFFLEATEPLPRSLRRCPLPPRVRASRSGDELSR